MATLEVDQQVKILDTAFPESPDERDLWARGKTGIIIYDLSLSLGDGWEDCFEVELDNKISDDDDGIYNVLASEIEAAA